MNKRPKLPPYQRKKATKTVNYFTMSINATMIDLPHGMEPMEHQVAGSTQFFYSIFIISNNKFFFYLLNQRSYISSWQWYNR